MKKGRQDRIAKTLTPACSSLLFFKEKNGIKKRTKGAIRLTVILFFYIIDKSMVSTWGVDFTKVYGLLGF